MKYKYLTILTVWSCVILVISDASAGKIIDLFGFSVSISVLFFPFTFLISDLLTEVYGYTESRKVVWLSVFCTLFTAIIFQIVAYFPSALPDGQLAYNTIFAMAPRIVLGSAAAVFAGSFINDYVLAKMKVWMKGKMLWARTIFSTMMGQIGDTLLFYMIAFYGILPNEVLIEIMVVGWFIKVLIEIVFTPVTYRVVKYLKHAEGVDYFDHNTNFNPFRLSS
jgi:queuosine precursor transporter